MEKLKIEDTQKWFLLVIKDLKRKPYTTIGGSVFIDRLEQLVNFSMEKTGKQND